MGAYSTINVTESKARSYLIQKIAAATDYELQKMLDEFLYDQLYDCQVVPDHCEENDDNLLSD